MMTVFLTLILRPNAEQVLEKLSMIDCSCSSKLEQKAALSAYRASHTCKVVVLVLTFRRDVEFASNLVLMPTTRVNKVNILLYFSQYYREVYPCISRKELGPEYRPASHHLQWERVLISFHRLGQCLACFRGMI